MQELRQDTERLLDEECMSDLRFPSWQETVQLAILEFDLPARKGKVAAALEAMEVRRRVLGTDADHHDERIALEDAVRTLELINRDLPA
jgi:hypothetical protein